MGARGPQPLPPAIQELRNMDSRKRQPVAKTEIAAPPISGRPPPNLTKHGADLWKVIVEMQAQFAEAGLPPAVTESQRPALVSYCQTYSRYMKARDIINRRERELGAEAAMFVEMDDGDVKMHGAYRTEMDLAKTMVKMGRELGVSKATPDIALNQQFNNFGPSMPAAPADNVLALDRFKGRVVNG